MLPTLGLFWCLSAFELLLLLLPSSRARRTLAALLALLLALVTIVVLFVHSPDLFVGLFALVSAYRLVNLWRVVKGRTHEKYLRKTTIWASLWLITTQIILMLLWQSEWQLHITGEALWLIATYAALVSACVLFLSTVRHLWTTRSPRLSRNEARDNDLPTLTVAIPARNETDDLEDCLSSLIASNYPKLEILVLDDCSQNKRTPEIIRAYAHSGVRFIQGSVPDDNWLAKNWAYQQLYEAANGEVLLFCGVDVRFSPDSLRLLVAALVHKHKSMISVIPRNIIPPLLSYRASTLIQPMRYAWELALPRRLFRRPPVLSTCWLIRRDVIASAGGFGAVSRSVVPESYFARVSAVHDGYSFMQSDVNTGIASNKSIREQRSTTVRVQYPRVHRRIELVMFLSMAEFGCAVLPYVAAILCLLGVLPRPLFMPNIVTVLLLTVAYASIVTLTYRAWLVRALIAAPFATLLDIVLLHYSMIRYEFFSVIWKDRNVCIPVMRVAERLPELDDQ